jgi:hypothetical protein
MPLQRCGVEGKVSNCTLCVLRTRLPSHRAHDGWHRVAGRAVVIACRGGVARLGVAALEELHGGGLFYGAAGAELGGWKARMCPSWVPVTQPGKRLST